MLKTLLKVAAGAAVLLVGYGVYKTYTSPKIMGPASVPPHPNDIPPGSPANKPKGM